MRWKITYKIAGNVSIGAPYEGYAGHGLKLVCNSGRLEEIEHILETDDSLSEDEVFLASHGKLRFFWEYVNFNRLLPLRIASHHRERLDQVEGEPRLRTGTISMSGSVRVARPLVFPAEQVLTKLASDARLVRWLGWANKARLVEVDGAEAVRILYFVCEDWARHRPQAVDTQLVRELKHVRDFVSHARLDKNKAALQFLEQHLGAPTNRYDPANPKHEGLVRDYRQRAQQYIDAELGTML
jgi:hypothetical protein